MRWRPRETLKALPKRNDLLSKQRLSHMQVIRHHSTKRGARLVLHPAAIIYPEFRRTFFGFHQRIFILPLDQVEVRPLVQRQEEPK